MRPFRRPAVEELEDRQLMAAGDIDPTFGRFGDGRVITDFQELDERPAALAVQPDDRVVVAGGIFPSFDNFQDQDFLLVRYTAGGVLDTGFTNGSSGALGLAITRFGPGEDVARAVAVRGDGRIVMAGYAEVGVIGNFDFALARYTAGGVLDPTFGGGRGQVAVPFYNNRQTDDRINAIATLPGGKILAAGFAGNDMAVARFNADGTLDATFGGGDGKSIAAFAGGSAATSLAVQADGKFLAAGTAVGNELDFALARFNADGTLDTTFGGGDGKVTTHLNHRDVAGSVAVLAGGKVLLSGSSFFTQPNPAGNDFDVHRHALARYRANGTLDTTFGGDGKVVLNFGGSNRGDRMRVLRNGKILLAGTETIEQLFLLTRLNADGTPDGTFDGGDDGRVFVGFGGNGNFGTGLGFQSGGKIVMAGQVQPDSRFKPSIGLVRFRGDRSVQSPRGSISGRVFNDADADGVRDAGEAFLANVRVYVDADNDGVLDSTERRVLTSAAGSYTLGNLAAGTYRIRQVPPAGFRRSAPSSGSHTVTLAAGQDATGRNFGATRRIRISGAVFNDANGDRARQGAEAGLVDRRVYVDANRNGRLDTGERTALTDAAGNWHFNTLAAGTYVIRVDREAGFARTTPTRGSFTVRLASGATRSGLLFGERRV